MQKNLIFFSSVIRFSSIFRIFDSLPTTSMCGLRAVPILGAERTDQKCVYFENIDRKPVPQPCVELVSCINFQHIRASVSGRNFASLASVVDIFDASIIQCEAVLDTPPTLTFVIFFLVCFEPKRLRLAVCVHNAEIINNVLYEPVSIHRTGDYANEYFVHGQQGGGSKGRGDGEKGAGGGERERERERARERNSHII